MRRAAAHSIPVRPDVTAPAAPVSVTSNDVTWPASPVTGNTARN